MIKKIVVISFLFAFTFPVFASSVDTISIYSNSMHRDFKCVVIKPDSLKDAVAWPVVYLLHGYSGGYNNWIMRVPALMDYAEMYHLVIVCPDGGFSSWYLDSPMDSTMRYETYIGKEVPEYIDAHYPTIKNRKARAITGLSMGGHGGLFLGLRHAGFFGACGSMSGGVDLNRARGKFDIMKRIGDTISYAANWKKYSVINLVGNYPKDLSAGGDSLAIIIDCGTEDFFYPTNHALHEKMLQLGISHDYIERPGKHDWAYWRNAVQYQLLFFHNYFTRQTIL